MAGEIKTKVSLSGAQSRPKQGVPGASLGAMQPVNRGGG